MRQNSGFFGQLLLSMKLPSLLPAIEEALATEHSVVIQLVSTAEALLDRRLADLSAEDRAEIRSTSRPRGRLMELHIRHILCSRSLCRAWRREAQVSFGFP
jgi:hypothetical protein